MTEQAVGEHRAPERGGCLIVGVGASAGGLEAFQLFLRHMPPHERLALVYVAHLDPHHASVLPEVLAHEAQMPVQAAADNTRVEAGRIYVIPPNTSLSVHDGVLHLGPRGAPSDLKPIDAFLVSLAEDQGDCAVGVILSGSGTDGTTGLRAIKEHGGGTIAQVPESAAFDSMPASAIAAGVVDSILRPDEMPARLLELASQVEPPADDGMRGTPAAIDEALPGIWDIVLRRTGHDFSSYKRSTLLRRIGRRMDALEIPTPAEYLKRLEQDASEASHLLQEMLIGVTSFFRDPAAFQVLAQRVLPGLVSGNTERGQVRVWVVGCASGEEVYSLAMLLAEEMARVPAPPKVQVFATDIDEDALRVARRGRYPAEACRGIAPDRLARFFTRDDDCYQVRKALRQLCAFSKHNLLHDPPFPDLDLIACRNLLIYLGTPVQGKAIALFHYALRSQGTLFLGTAENIAGRQDLFGPLEPGQRIYRRLTTAGRTEVEIPLTASPKGGRVRPVQETASPLRPEVALQRSVERAVLDEYTPAGLVVREEGHVLYVFGPTTPYLGPSAGAPSLNALTLVRKSLRGHLRRALQDAARTRERVTVECALAADAGGPAARVKLMARPFTGARADHGLYLVIFQDLPVNPEAAEGPAAVEDVAVRHLQDELRDTREQLQATLDERETANQELQSANEELLSMNEELQSANEELQSSKEEVQSINAELESVNRELVQKVDALDSASADLESLFEGAQVATIFVDNTLAIKRFTPTATDVFRLRPGDVGRPVADITARFTNGDVIAEIRNVLSTLQRRDITVSRPDDGTRYLMRILPYRTRQDVIDGAVLTFMDVTELKRTQEALERSNDELERRVAERTAALQMANHRKDDFLAMLSHELRNPLAAIASNVHLWQAQHVTDPRLTRARELAARQVDHMTHLLDDLLDTARIVRGTVEIRRESVDLAHLVRDAVGAASARFAGRHQEMSVSLPDGPLQVEGDRYRLQQVIGNLLDNAQKYSLTGGHIRLSAEATEGEIVLRVRDDGIGIPPTLLPYVFDSFVQGNQGSARAQGGLGLGLTLVQQMVTLHGGSVEARSGGEGKGSEFVVRLPRGSGTPTTPSPAAPAEAEAPVLAMSRKRILVVDDNADAAELLVMLLKMDGHDVMMVHDGPAALQVASAFSPEVVLLDLGLPGMDGYEIARGLRQIPALASTALVAVTGYGRDEDRQRSRKAGFDHHLVKPVDMDTLRRVLQRIVPPSEQST
jgi:two-component system, chemotaxis family, CheB/CheR fusion protein